MDVSIIIVNYNTKDLTSNCIESIFENTFGVSYEIILVDNASSDGSVDFFSKDKRIVFIPSNVNLGFGGANNLGYQYVSGNYIFLLNSDTILLNNALKVFLDFISENDNVGALGGLLYDANGDITHFAGRFPSMRNFLIRSLKGYANLIGIRPEYGLEEYAEIDGKLYSDVDYITGADLFIPRSVIKKIGFFDKDFFMYFEETDLQKRMENHGLRRLILTRSHILHLEGASQRTSGKSNRSKILMIKSMFIYMKKHKKRIGYYCFKVMYFILSLPHLFNYSYPIRQRMAFLKVLIWA